ncbi:MAG: hypothetical protein ACO4AU_07340 [bacterium]
MHVDLLLRDMQEIFQEQGPLDFMPLLEHMSRGYDLDPQILLARGFRKAYRQLVEGV